MGLRDVAAAGNYTELGGLRDLSRLARQSDPSAKDLVARQFEAILVQQMLTQMRQAMPATEDSMLGQAGELYRDLLDKQLAVQLSESGGIGLRDVIVAGMGGAGNDAEASAAGGPRVLRMPSVPDAESRALAAERTLERVRETLIALGADPFNEGMALEGSAPDIMPTRAGSEPFEGPQDFVARLRNSATRAARSLNTDPGVLLAQAALETGWGRHLITGENGKPSHNLFGIKADAGWQGPKVSVTTTEYRGGKAVKETASFRAYASFEDSFSDYVSFLQENPRYGKALQASTDATRFIQALQRAGYATDPRYAAKIVAVMNTTAIDATSEPLKR
jgi:peptidoglycan hydrolase FlgJ